MTHETYIPVITKGNEDKTLFAFKKGTKGALHWMCGQPSCRVYGFNVKDRSLTDSIYLPFLHLHFPECCPIKTLAVAFPWVISFKEINPHRFQGSMPLTRISYAGVTSSAASCSRPGNKWQGVDRQHGWCLPTTQQVTGISTSAGRAGSFLSLWHTVRRWKLTYKGMSAGQHWYSFGVGYRRYVMPESAGHYKPLLYFLSMPLTEEQEIDVSDMPFFHQQIRYTLYYSIIFSSTGPNTNRHGHPPQFPCGR